MKKILASILAFFASKGGTVLEVDDNAETVTLTREQAQQLNDEIAATTQLRQDLETANGQVNTLTEDKTSLSGQLTAAGARLSAIATRLGLKAEEGKNISNEQVDARIDQLLALPGSAGSQVETDDDDDLGDGGQKQPVHSWEKKGAQIDARNKKLNK